jgi:hypothetical protein
MPNTVSFSVTGITREDLASPLDFDLVLTAVADNPVSIIEQYGSGISGQVNIASPLLAVDGEGYIQASVFENESNIQTRIREALKYRLGRIKPENGYTLSIVEVLDDPPAKLSDAQQTPAVVPIWGKTTVATETNSDLGLESLIWLYCLTSEESTVSLSIENLTANFMACIGLFPNMTHEDGIETCQRVRLASLEPFGNKESRPAVGVKIGLRIWWSVSTRDPSIMGSAL